ncbi:hypothetical protein BH09PLA1_BH09PLA1_01160 [soil metagenome]
MSQYYEGTSNDRWIEVYNLGPGAIDLSSNGYRLGQWSNAARQDWKTGLAPSSTTALTGMIASGGTYILAHSMATLPFASGRANQTNSSVQAFTGDDSVVLYTGTTYAFANVSDAFGLTGNTAMDKSFSRKTSVTTGTTTDFNAANWDEFTNLQVDSAAVAVDQRIGIYRRGGMTVTWDQNGTGAGIGGAGTWDTSGARFASKADSVVTSDFYAWSDSTNARDNVHFGGTAGAVALGANRTVGGVMFSVTGYQITGTSQTLTFDGTGIVDTIGSGVSAQITAPIITASGVTLVKAGAGVLTLPGNNNYTGATTIRAGKLFVNGTHTSAGAYSVNASATLGGSGAITLAAGNSATIAGNIAPGQDQPNGPGTLTLHTSAGGVTELAQGGSYTWEINSQTGTAGTSWDLLQLDAVAVTATTGGFKIKVVSLAPNGTPGNISNWNAFPSPNARFTIATSSDSSFANVDLAKFVIDTTQFADNYPAGFHLEVSGNGANLDLVYVP